MNTSIHTRNSAMCSRRCSQCIHHSRGLWIKEKHKKNAEVSIDQVWIAKREYQECSSVGCRKAIWFY